MRLFTALELNAKVIQNLTELVRRLRPCAPIKWVHPQNMHVTLKYIGDWQVGRLEELVRSLNQVKLPMALNVPLAGLGFFPHARNPRVFWAGAENTPALRQLASQVDVELQRLGIAPEVRPYHPHLTLGRIVENEPLDELHHVIEDLPSREFGTISPDRFVLFESTLTAAAPIYRKIAEFPFVTQLGEPVGAARPMFAGKV
jgi:2'-5' RNA ligase